MTVQQISYVLYVHYLSALLCATLIVEWEDRIGWSCAHKPSEKYKKIPSKQSPSPTVLTPESNN